MSDQGWSKKSNKEELDDRSSVSGTLRIRWERHGVVKDEGNESTLYMLCWIWQETESTIQWKLNERECQVMFKRWHNEWEHRLKRSEGDKRYEMYCTQHNSSYCPSCWRGKVLHTVPSWCIGKTRCHEVSRVVYSGQCKREILNVKVHPVELV